MKLLIGRKNKIKKGSIIIAKCRFCGKVYRPYDLIKEAFNPKEVSYQIITCKDCRDQLPKDDYIGRKLEAD